MRNRIVAALLTMLALPLSAAEGIDPEILAVREAAWRAWFAGDETAFRAMLPADFLGIGWGGDAISDRDTTLASSRAFKESGGRLASLSFPETRAQRNETGTNKEHVRGRLTEVFVKRDGRWVHPGWHLDAR